MSGSGAQHATRQEGLLPYPSLSPTLAASLTTQAQPVIRDCPWEWTLPQGQGWIGRTVSATVGLIQALNCQEAVEVVGERGSWGGVFPSYMLPDSALSPFPGLPGQPAGLDLLGISQGP